MSIDEAIKRAEEAGLDLIEVAATAEYVGSTVVMFRA